MGHGAHGGHGDAWHHHTADEGLPQAEHASVLNPRFAIGFIALTIAFLVVFIGGTILYFNVTVRKEIARKQETTGISAGYAAMRSQSDYELSSYGVVDPASRTVRVPVDRAIERVVNQYKPSK